MIDISEFLAAAVNPAVLDKKLNPEQIEAVKHGRDPALMIVAGPGSGKTTVLVLRALRHVLIDGYEPENVLVTTFTRKAAGELRDRLIDWGTRLIAHFINAKHSDALLVQRLRRIDINSFQTGTLDSFLQDWLRAIRTVGEPNRIMLEQFAAKFIYRRRIFGGAIQAAPFGSPPSPFYEYLGQFNGGDAPRTVADAADKSFELTNRLIQDLVDIDQWVKAGTTPGEKGLTAEQMQYDLFKRYLEYLDKQRMVEFSTCAQQILQAATAGNLYPNPSVPRIRALLVDEYQDTNPIQEAIYLELAKRSGASFTIVGDDDQSLYRFRGATVELFTNFATRYQQQVSPTAPRLLNLMRNYRSSPEIVNFFNQFAAGDPSFAPARVAGKPVVVHTQPSEDVPVLGLFRDSPTEIAEELAAMLHDIFAGGGFTIPGTNVKIERDPKWGALGDALLLSSTVREFKETGEPRLPHFLRDQLERRGLGVFNPRGQDLRDIPNVRVLLGLVAECVDDTDDRHMVMHMTSKAKEIISGWREDARQFIGTNPAPNTGTRGLHHFVRAWKMRTPQGSNKKWPEEWPLLDLVYKLIAWMPEFQDDPEHQIYLEAITRCIAQGGNYSKYNLDILNLPSTKADADVHNGRSANAVFSDVLAPLALREIDVDEDLLFALPRSRANVMTIHQSKGLEFPVVIVDVGSDFKTNHAKQAFRRFPRSASAQAEMEDYFAPHTPIGPFRTARQKLDRTFDDLMRLYYVAYSRPKHVLVLVGTPQCMQYVVSCPPFFAFQGSMVSIET